MQTCQKWRYKLFLAYDHIYWTICHKNKVIFACQAHNNFRWRCLDHFAATFTSVNLNSKNGVGWFNVFVGISRCLLHQTNHPLKFFHNDTKYTFLYIYCSTSIWKMRLMYVIKWSYHISGFHLVTDVWCAYKTGFFCEQWVICMKISGWKYSGKMYMKKGASFFLQKA